MSVTANESSLPVPMRRISFMLILATVLIVAIFVLASLAGSPLQTEYLDNLHWSIAYLTAAMLAWHGVRVADPDNIDSRRCFAYGLTCCAVGQLCWDLQTLAQLTSYPAVSDFLFLAFGPCCVWGVWRVFKQHTGNIPSWPLVIDATTLAVVLLGAVLAMYVTHYDFANRVALVVMVIYPISMLASCCLTLVLMLTVRLKPHAGWLLFTIACLLNGLLWMHWIYLSQSDEVVTNRWLHLSFSLVTLGLGVGAMRWRVSISVNATLNRRYDFCLRSLPLLAAGVAVVGVLIARNLPAQLNHAAQAIYISAGLVFCLTVIRQSLLLFERERLLAVELRHNELEQDLHLMAERLKLATRAAGIGVFEYQPSSDTLLWDQQMHLLYGTTPATFGGIMAEWKKLVHPDDFNLLHEKYYAALSTGSEYQAISRIVRPDGSIRYLEARANTYGTTASMRIIGVNWDVTTQVESEANRMRLEAQLRQSQKLEAIGTLASGIAHDFNNILGTILGNGELALQDMDAQHPARASVLEIRSAGQRARDLIRRIVTFGKPHDQNFRATSLATLVEDTLKLVRATVPAGVEIYCRLPADLPLVRVDSSQIAQVLLNLCSNAYQSMPQHKGCIDIELSAHDFSADAHVPDRELKPGSYLCLQVRDTGSGFDAAIAERIFEPFFTTKPVGEGSGLGLSIVHNIVRNHAGAIQVDSQPGQGTNFRLYFPVATDQPGSEPVVIASNQHTEYGSGQHILYLDDEESLVLLTTRMLERFGYRVTGCSDAMAALQAALAQPADFDLIITDQSMPVMSGMDLARELLARRPAARIMLVSGYLTQHDIELALKLGIKEVMLKPDTVDELAATVHRLLSTPGAHSRQDQTVAMSGSRFG